VGSGEARSSTSQANMNPHESLGIRINPKRCDAACYRGIRIQPVHDNLNEKTDLTTEVKSGMESGEGGIRCAVPPGGIEPT